MKVYTFRTNPFKDKLKKIFPDIFVFGKLNEDFNIFCEKVLNEKPVIILGIAKTNNKSQFETKTINKFNKNKKISVSGKEYFNLLVPDYNCFNISKNTSNSFCNWTMYKISEFIENNNLNTKLMFIHLNENDLIKLNELKNAIRYFSTAQKRCLK